MAIKAPRRKKPVRTSKTLDEKYMGTEPMWGQEPCTSAMMQRAYNWYNYFHNYKQHAKAVRSFYKKDKAKYKLLSKLPDWKFGHVPATVCHLITNGNTVMDQSQDWFENHMKKLFGEAETMVEEKKKEEKKTKVGVSIQERIREQISNYIGEIEEQIDVLTNANYKSDFKMYDWLRSNNVKSQQSGAIADYYRPLLEELELARTGKDPDMKEAYASVSSKQLKVYFEFVKMIIDDASTWGSNQKTVRRTRVKKPQSVQKQISKVNYKTDDKDLKLVSINPAEVIGASQLWIYDTKDRKLKKFDAIDRGGLSFKGTTLINFNADTSDQKKLRKPEEILPQVLTGGKRVLSKLLEGINTKGSSPNGRINPNHILLRAVK